MVFGLRGERKGCNTSARESKIKPFREQLLAWFEKDRHGVGMHERLVVRGYKKEAFGRCNGLSEAGGRSCSGKRFCGSGRSLGVRPKRTSEPWRWSTEAGLRCTSSESH